MTDLIWKPNVPGISTDGLPLVTTVEQFFFHFPYDRMPPLILTDGGGAEAKSSVLEKVVHYSMLPEVVISLLVFYMFLSEPLFTMIRTTIGLSPNNLVLRVFVAVHNMALAIFSGVVAFHTWLLVVDHYLQFGFMATYCDVDGTLWESGPSTGGFGAWCILFYLSKYYEFLDSWILVLKGKKVSFLQTYHHTGIVFVMWGGVASHAAWLQFVVLLNSAIHTAMYTYYFLKTIRPTLEIKAAKYLTMAQIAQFLTGISCTLGVFALGDTCTTGTSSRFFLACLHLYGIGLIALFVSFANQKYSKKQD